MAMSTTISSRTHIPGGRTVDKWLQQDLIYELDKDEELREQTLKKAPCIDCENFYKKDGGMGSIKTCSAFPNGIDQKILRGGRCDKKRKRK